MALKKESRISRLTTGCWRITVVYLESPLKHFKRLKPYYRL